MKYMLVSLFSYRPFSLNILSWLKKRSNPDSPGEKAGVGVTMVWRKMTKKKKKKKMAIYQ